jgi:drug/metabolite transporter (DMT)-like permease
MRVEALYLVLGVLTSSFSQILLKKSADKYGVAQNDDQEVSALRRLFKQYANPLVVTGYGLLLAAALIPLYAFQFVELKYGAVIESLGYVFIMLLSAALLHEKITRRKVLGNIIIIAGVILFGIDIF